MATAVDSAGNLYLTGSAGSGLQTTPGAFKTTGGGAYVAKLNPAGALIYATYLGSGSLNNDSGIGIAVDAAGDAYVIGENSNVPTTANAIASASGQLGIGNSFVAELNPTGSGLVYATYLPGTVNYFPRQYTYGYSGGIAVDSAGNIYMAGAAQSGLPVTAGAFQSAYRANSGGCDAYFMEINPALSGTASVVYASFLGGTGGLGDAASGIALDSAGNAYLEGYTSSTDLPTTSGAFQPTFASVVRAGTNVFVAKFNPALSGAASLVYSTYLGGSGGDGYVSQAVVEVPQIDGGIAVDSAGNAYVTSATASTNFPTTPGAYQVSSGLQNSRNGFGSPSDVFVTKLNPTGTALVYSTYLGSGGSTASDGAGVAVDANGDAFVTGWTNSTAFPTKNPVQSSTNSGGFNSFVTELNPAGSGILFSTYLGDSTKDYHGFGVALDSAGNVYDGGGIALSAGAYSGSGFADKIALAPGPFFSVTGYPSSTTAGVANTITVTADDASGNLNPNYTGTVHFTSTDPQAVLPADYTFTAADQGVHTFSVTLKTAGLQSIIVADGVTGMPGSETGITVNPAAASTLIVSGFPLAITQGVSGTFTVTAMDPYGNVATGYTGTVHFTSSDPRAKLPADYSFTAADNGVHTFKAIFNTVGTESLTATDTVNSLITGIETGIVVKSKR
jgi:hypothetical protein